MGAYTLKSGIELCLLATKGKTTKLLKSRKVRSLLSSQREEHSKKPDEIRNRIELLCGKKTKKIELFARQNYKGWDAFGNEVKKSIKLKKIKTRRSKSNEGKE